MASIGLQAVNQYGFTHPHLQRCGGNISHLALAERCTSNVCSGGICCFLAGRHTLGPPGLCLRDAESAKMSTWLVDWQNGSDRSFLIDGLGPSLEVQCQLRRQVHCKCPSSSKAFRAEQFTFNLYVLVYFSHTWVFTRVAWWCGRILFVKRSHKCSHLCSTSNDRGPLCRSFSWLVVFQPHVKVVLLKRGNGLYLCARHRSAYFTQPRSSGTLAPRGQTIFFCVRAVFWAWEKRR